MARVLRTPIWSELQLVLNGLTSAQYPVVAVILVFLIVHLLGSCVTKLIGHGDMVVAEQAMLFSNVPRLMLAVFSIPRGR